MKVLSRNTTEFAPNSEVLFVKAGDIDQVYRITVTLPISKLIGEAPPHGTLVLDGDIMSTLAPGVVNLLSMTKVIPPQVVVTVGYPLDSATVWNNLRVRDLTPVSYKQWSKFQSRQTNSKCPDGGGAQKFLAFLNEELKIFIEAEYGVDPAEWTLTGASFGGLFSTFALISDISRFSRYNIINPSYWFRAPFMQNLSNEFAAQLDPVKASVMFSVGALETSELVAPHMSHLSVNEIALFGGVPDMMLDMMEIAAIMRKRAGLRVSAVPIPDEDHYSVLGSALTRGLRWLYSKPATK